MKSVHDGLQTLTGYTAAEVNKIFTYLDVGTKYDLTFQPLGKV